MQNIYMVEQIEYFPNNTTKYLVEQSQMLPPSSREHKNRSNV